MAQTASEKILARASGRARVAPGDVVVARVDRAMTYDPYAGELRRRFAARWGGRARVWDPERLVLVADHFLDADAPDQRALLDGLDAFAREQGVRHYFPVGAPNHGVCHAVLPEEGLVRPGELIAGTDSHTCHYGGFGAIGLGIGLDAMEGILAVGRYWVEVPPMVRIEIEGRFATGVYAKDVILTLCRDLANERGLLGTAVDLDGSAVQALHPEEKLTLANMAAELGARWLLVPPDDTVCAWVRDLGADGFEPQRPDPGARYARTWRYDACDFVPVVARPGAPDRVVAVDALEPTRFDEVYVGSCTGAKRFDLERFVDGLDALGGAAQGVRTLMVPATRRGHDWLLGDPARRALLERSRVEVAAQPGCNACFGGHGFLAGTGTVRLSTTNRNFPGRMGAKDAQVFLASPALAARAAAEGTLGP